VSFRPGGSTPASHNKKLFTPKTVRDLSSRQLVHVRLSGVPVLELTGALPLHVYLLAKLADPEGIEPPSAGGWNPAHRQKSQ